MTKTITNTIGDSNITKATGTIYPFLFAPFPDKATTGPYKDSHK